MSGNKHICILGLAFLSVVGISYSSIHPGVSYPHFVENFMLTGNNGCKFLLVIRRHILILLMTVFFLLILCTKWSTGMYDKHNIHNVSRKTKKFCLLLWQTYVCHHVNKFLYRVSTYLNITNDCRDKNSKYTSEADPKA